MDDTQSTSALPTLGFLLEDTEMAQKRSAQLAALVPVITSGQHPCLLELAIELAGDLTNSLSNLR